MNLQSDIIILLQFQLILQCEYALVENVNLLHVPIRGVVSTCLVHLSKFGLEQADFLFLSFALGNKFIDNMLLLVYVHLPVEVFAPQTDLQVFSSLRG